MSVLEVRINNGTIIDVPLREKFIAFLNTPLIAPHSLMPTPSKDLVETLDDAYEECFECRPIKPVTIGDYFSITRNAIRYAEKHGSDSDVIDQRISSSRAIMRDLNMSKEQFPLLWNILKTPVVTFGEEFNIPLPTIYDSKKCNKDTLGDLLELGIIKTRKPWYPEEISLEEYGSRILEGYNALHDLFTIFYNASLCLFYEREKKNNEYKRCI